MNTTTMTRATVCRAVLAKRSGSSASSFLRSSTPFKAAVAPRLTFNPTNDASNSRTVQVQANLFSRFGRVVKSYANALINRAEDPEKMLDQTVNEMTDDLVKLRQATAQVMASQKQLENKYKQAQTTADDWYRRAQLALEKGEEELAREALQRRKQYQDNADSLKGQLDTQAGTVEKLIQNTRVLETKLSEAKSKKDTLKARAASARTQQKVNEIAGGISTTSAAAAFDKMEEKVMGMEAQADAVAQISTDDLDSKFAALEGDSVDDELKKMKGALKGSSTKGSLPEGRAVKEAIDPIDAELEALRKKAKDM
mmetsp:Transcript_5388/g.19704  ORF Transcript_5388/g.19704 Transcript_5388/m.19704 type:complete len:312 (-) Transcript_5388:147-1082(-)